MANAQSGLPSRVCVNFYDVHGGGTVASGNFQDVNGAKEITVDANGDNSIQTNDFDVTEGANCINLTQPGIVTHATDAAAGSPITDTREPPAGSTILTADSPCGTPTTGDHKEVSTVSKVSPTVVTNAGGPFTLGASGSDLTDSATLAGGTAGISGTITFSLFSDTNCSVQVGSDVTKTVSGNGVYVSSPVHVSAAGTYHWIANYGGDANNNPTANGCNEANENVLVIRPAIAISKKPDSQTIRNGGTAIWTITVTNTGDVALTAVHVTDAQAPGCARTAAQIAADRGSSTFAPSASYSYTCSLTGVTASFTNTAVATGTPPVGDDVSAQDSADVLVINPHITVVKTPHEQTIRSGDSVSWTIQVINDGDSTLTDVKVTDAQAPGCARTSADISGLASMPAAPAAGSTVTYQCSRANNTDSFTNVADAIGTPRSFPRRSSRRSSRTGSRRPRADDRDRRYPGAALQGGRSSDR